MLINIELLEKTCKDIIETILTCLPEATKGTIYQIGPMPELQAGRITSGIRIEASDEIHWGLPSVSDYNCPGKVWEQYRDAPDHPLEAMGWCVEQQKSWTADNPAEDTRSVRKQLLGEIEDSYHMEPVLVKKKDLYGAYPGKAKYPVDWNGNPIWQSTDYVVVAVIKIHFLPRTLERNSRATKAIKKLSRTLGTQLLSLQLRDTLLRDQKELTRQRLESSKMLAHELRNTLIKFSFLFSAVNTQISVLRQEWEAQLRKAFPHLEFKESIFGRLNELSRSRLASMEPQDQLSALCRALLMEQEELANMPLLPDQEKQWLKNKIQPKWEHLLSGAPFGDSEKEEINELLGRLEQALKIGTNEELAEKMSSLPRDLRETWPRLAYIYFTPDKLWVLDEVLELLDHPGLKIPHKQQMKKTLKSLKALIEVVSELEEKINKIILSLKNGHPMDMEEQTVPYASVCQAPGTPGKYAGRSPLPERVRGNDVDRRTEESRNRFD